MTATLTLPAIRNICPGDYARLKAFVHKLSRDTSYQRLLSPRTPTEDELRRWAAIDPTREGALVAVNDEEELVGVARYALESPNEADFAIVIADDWQGRGLGRQLLVRLVAAARQAGVGRLGGLTLATNVAMLSLARSLGFVAARQGFTTRLSLDLSPVRP